MNELAPSVIISLAEETSENPQLGWTRGSSYDTSELLSQVNKLKLEKEKLEREILELIATTKTNSNKAENLAGGIETYKITGVAPLKYSASGYSYDEAQLTLTLDEIFSYVGPYLVPHKNYSEFKDALIAGINSEYKKHFSILNDNCVQTIKVQLKGLGLIDVKTIGFKEFIELTPKGKNYLLNLKSIKNKVK
jgi:hypothetical protein